MGKIIQTFRKIETAISKEKPKATTPRKPVTRSLSLEERLIKNEGQYITYLNNMYYKLKSNNCRKKTR